MLFCLQKRLDLGGSRSGHRSACPPAPSQSQDFGLCLLSVRQWVSGCQPLFPLAMYMWNKRFLREETGEKLHGFLYCMYYCRVLVFSTASHWNASFGGIRETAGCTWTETWLDIAHMPEDWQSVQEDSSFHEFSGMSTDNCRWDISFLLQILVLHVVLSSKYGGWESTKHCVLAWPGSFGGRGERDWLIWFWTSSVT